MSSGKTVKKGQIDGSCFNSEATLPFNLRLDDFRVAMQDVYDFLHDTNTFLVTKGLSRLDDTLRPANMSGFLSDMLTELDGQALSQLDAQSLSQWPSRPYREGSVRR